MQIITTVDDLHQAEDGEQVQADRTHTLALNGRRVEIDLTAAHYKELDEALARYFKAGRTNGTSAQSRGACCCMAPRTVGMRAYADANGINYRYPSGKPYNPKGLQAEYDALPAADRKSWEEKGAAALAALAAQA